jgi:hypothetical protein
VTETYTTYENTKKQQRKKTCKTNDRASHDKVAEADSVGKTLEGSSDTGTAGVGGME